MATVPKVTAQGNKTSRNSTLSNSQVASYLSKTIDTKGIKQSDLAFEIGYTKPNIITMFKQGLTKLPINKVKIMAEALQIDPVHLLRLVLQEYQPETLDSIEEIYGYAVTENEMKVIEALRDATDDSDPVIHSAALKELKKVFNNLT